MWKKCEREWNYIEYLPESAASLSVTQTHSEWQLSVTYPTHNITVFIHSLCSHSVGIKCSMWLFSVRGSKILLCCTRTAQQHTGLNICQTDINTTLNYNVAVTAGCVNEQMFTKTPSPCQFKVSVVLWVKTFSHISLINNCVVELVSVCIRYIMNFFSMHVPESKHKKERSKKYTERM